MALTEQQRAEIYSSLADTVGQQEAEFLMAQQPPGGWEQFATKRDLADLETKTQAGFVALNAKMDVQFAQLREQLAEQFAEIKKHFAAVDTRFAEVKEHFAAVDTRFAEVKEHFAAVDTRFAEVKEHFAAVDTRSEVKEHFAAVDTRFAELSDKRSRDVWAFVVAITVVTVSICGSVFLAAWQFGPA